jgi:hypothetical protein
MDFTMMSGYILLLLIVLVLGYTVYLQYYSDSSTEGFYPRRWWWGPGRQWGWRRPWLQGWGNWRPYGYYPAYSGYWKQCPSGAWCPATNSCNSLACQ